MMKTCRTCKADKERSEFYYLPAGGREASCKACKIESVKRWQRENPAYMAAARAKARAKYRAEHPDAKVRKP